MRREFSTFLLRHLRRHRDLGNSKIEIVIGLYAFLAIDGIVDVLTQADLLLLLLLLRDDLSSR